MTFIQSLALVGVLAAPSFVSADDLPPDCGLYLYRADIVRVIDGDTVVANIDLGFRTWLHDQHLRLFGIDTPELNTPEGERVAQLVTDRVKGKTLYICTHKASRSDNEQTGSFGRYLVEIYVDGASLNQWLLDQGHAVGFEK